MLIFNEMNGMCAIILFKAIKAESGQQITLFL